MGLMGVWYLFDGALVAVVSRLDLHLSLGQTQSQSLQLSLETPPPQLHPCAPPLGRLQSLTQPPTLRLQARLASAQLTALLLQGATGGVTVSPHYFKSIKTRAASDLHTLALSLGVQ